jgi:hypothetical protein
VRDKYAVISDAQIESYNGVWASRQIVLIRLSLDSFIRVEASVIPEYSDQRCFWKKRGFPLVLLVARILGHFHTNSKTQLKMATAP